MAIVCFSHQEDKDGEKGLVGGHAYTLTGASRIPCQGRLIPMFRVRNPWGTGKGEWTGRWSDGAAEWDSVDPDTKERLHIQGRDDGEFWMDLKDYVEFFPNTHICNLTPDFDQDGTTDGLGRIPTLNMDLHRDGGCNKVFIF